MEAALSCLHTCRCLARNLQRKTCWLSRLFLREAVQRLGSGAYGEVRSTDVSSLAKVKAVLLARSTSAKIQRMGHRQSTSKGTSGTSLLLAGCSKVDSELHEGPVGSSGLSSNLVLQLLSSVALSRQNPALPCWEQLTPRSKHLTRVVHWAIRLA